MALNSRHFARSRCRCSLRRSLDSSRGGMRDEPKERLRGCRYQWRFVCDEGVGFRRREEGGGGSGCFGYDTI